MKAKRNGGIASRANEDAEMMSMLKQWASTNGTDATDGSMAELNKAAYIPLTSDDADIAAETFTVAPEVLNLDSQPTPNPPRTQLADDDLAMFIGEDSGSNVQGKAAHQSRSSGSEDASYLGSGESPDTKSDDGTSDLFGSLDTILGHSSPKKPATDTFQDASDASVGAVLLEESSSEDSHSTPDDSSLAKLARDLAVLDPKAAAASSDAPTPHQQPASSLSWLEGASDNIASSGNRDFRTRPELGSSFSESSDENADLFEGLKQLLGPPKVVKGRIGQEVEHEFNDLGKQQEMDRAAGHGPTDASLLQGQAMDFGRLEQILQQQPSSAQQQPTSLLEKGIGRPPTEIVHRSQTVASGLAYQAEGDQLLRRH